MKGNPGKVFVFEVGIKWRIMSLPNKTLYNLYKIGIKLSCIALNQTLLPLKTWQWRHNEHDSVSNHQPHDCLLNRLFGRRPKKTSNLTGLCAGNSPGTGEFPAQMVSNAENVSIWWRHHDEVTLGLISHSRFDTQSHTNVVNEFSKKTRHRM